MTRDLRLLITTACDMACKYCINNQPGVLDQFPYYESWSSIRFGEYDCVKITGGEPFMVNHDVLAQLTFWLHKLGAKKIVIYTNGKILDRLDYIPDLPYLDGYSIGIHEEYMAPEQYLRLHLRIRERFPDVRVRFLGIRQLISDELCTLAARNQMDLTLLELNEKCDNPNEQRMAISI